MRNPRHLPKYVSEFADRHGKMRVRFRRKGQEDHYFRAVPWTQEFMLEYQACLNREEAPAIAPGISRVSAGTINALIVSYYGAPIFKGKGESTKKNYRRIIEKFRAKHRDKPVSMIRTRHVHKIIGDLSETPAAANSILSRLRTIFKHAIKIGLIDINPTNDVDRYESKGDGHHTWTEEDIEAFERRHPVGSKAWFAAALMLYTGQRRCDAIEMGWNRVSGGLIGVRQIKTRKIVYIPLHPELEMAISSMPRSRESFLVTEFGKPFTSNGFGNWFRDRCREAGLEHCAAHGLRKAAARRLAEAGCTNAEIKAITGHTTDQEVARYTAAVDRKRLARQAMDKTYGMSGELKVV